MKFIADFHIHSKYSRATSKSTDLDNIAKYAKIKGVDVMGTGDFTHYLWIKEIKEKIEPCGNGVFCIKGDPSLKFVLTSEISCIYTKNGKTRKIQVLK